VAAQRDARALVNQRADLLEVALGQQKIAHLIAQWRQHGRTGRRPRLAS
jgi:hypothetical protein